MKTSEIVYDPAHQLTLDLYRPEQPNTALVVIVHGGGWIKGDKATEASLAGHFTAQGYLVAVPNYRLAPAHRYPAQHDDLSTALAWLRASPWPFDRDRIGVIGASAGGNLAAEAAVRHGVPIVSWSGLLTLDRFFASVAGLASSPVANAAAPSGSRPEPTGIDQSGRNDPYYKWCIEQLTGGVPEVVTAASVEHRIDGNSGPMMLVNSIDEFIPATEIGHIQAALTAAKVESFTQLIPGSRHGEGYLDRAIGPALTFFADHLLDVASTDHRTGPAA